METRTNHRARLMAIVIACFAVACLALAACGGSGGSSAASSSADASSSASASASSSDSASRSASSTSGASTGANAAFTGTWQLAAAETQGITMGGNFSQMLGVNGGFKLTFNADGTGKMELGTDAGELTWAANDDSSIYMTPQSATDAMKQEAILVTLKDGALFVPYEQNGQQTSLIFTHDGSYAGAKQVTAEGAQPITSEADLLGTWNLTGMNLGGISMHGDAQSMASAMGNAATTITFKEGGVLETSSGQGTWAVGPDGATITTTDATGTSTVPVTKMGDDIVIDYSTTFSGTEFIMLMAKA